MPKVLIFALFCSKGKPPTNRRMSSLKFNTPRFLLPRLTWKGFIHEHQIAVARGLSTWHHSRNHTLLIIWRRKSLFAPFRVPSSAPSLNISRNSFWRTHSVSSSKVLPLPTSTLSFASSFNANTRTIRRSFSTTPQLLRDHHFDTLKCAQRLKSEGFSEEQSKAMMLVLSDVIEESIQNLTRTMVLREGYPSSSFLFYLFKYLY